MATLADLLINLRADPSGIEEGMSRGKKLAAAGGAAIAAAVSAAAVSAVNVSAAGDKLAAQLGLTESESKRIGGVAGSLYADAYGDNIEDVNDAVAAVVSSIKGMSTASSADLESASAKALDFANAFDTDVTRAAEVAGVAINSGLAGDATQAFDLITKASQQVPVSLREDILDATEEYSKDFATLGISGAGAFGLLVKGAEQGQFGIDKTGDAIKQFVIRAGDLGDTAAQDALKGLGLNASATASAMNAGGKAAEVATGQIVDGLLGIKDPGRQAQAAIALFGTPLEDLGRQNIPDFLSALDGGEAALKDFDGAAADMGDTLNDNAATKLTAFKRQTQQAIVNVVGGVALPIIDKVAGTLSGTLGPAIQSVADVLDATLGPAVETVSDFFAENKTAARILGGIITAVVVPPFVVLAARATASAARVVVAFVTQQVAAARSAAAQAAVLAGLIANWIRMGLVALRQAARTAAAWLIAMGPIAIVTAAVIGLVVLIVKNWDTIVAVTKKVWGWFTDKLAAVWGWVKRIFRAGLDFVIGLITRWNPYAIVIRNFDKIVDGARWVWNQITRIFGDVVDFVTGLPSRIARAASGMWDGITGAFRAAINTIIGLWNGLRIPSVTIGGFDPLGPFGPAVPSVTIGGWDFPDIPLLADGGDVVRSGAAVVGERGPELLEVARGARVTPLADMRAREVEQTPAPEVRVFIGDRELTDIVDVQINDRDRRLRSRVRAGSRVGVAGTR